MADCCDQKKGDQQEMLRIGHAAKFALPNKKEGGR